MLWRRRFDVWGRFWGGLGGGSDAVAGPGREFRDDNYALQTLQASPRPLI